MDSLNDILSRKNFDEPPEIAAIKTYVQRQFKRDVGVQVQPKTIVITTAGASLAGALRLRIPQLQAAAQTDKKLIFRIGN